jgi:hypothetical protein
MQLIKIVGNNLIQNEIEIEWDEFGFDDMRSILRWALY